jgi:hypothetical protein
MASVASRFLEHSAGFPLVVDHLSVVATFVLKVLATLEMICLRLQRLSRLLGRRLLFQLKRLVRSGLGPDHGLPHARCGTLVGHDAVLVGDGLALLATAAASPRRSFRCRGRSGWSLFKFVSDKLPERSDTPTLCAYERLQGWMVPMLAFQGQVC